MKFDIRNYGAKPDGSNCTKCIQKAIDDCYLQGGGEVIVPSGTFLAAGLRLRSNVTLHLLENAVLQGSIDPEDYFAYLKDEIQPISEEELESVAPTIKPGAEAGRSAMPYSRWNNAVIRAIGAENIAIIGEKGSVIDGRNCYDALGEEGYRGPHAINFWYCEGVSLQGYTIKDSGNWAHAIQNSSDIRVSGITVLGGHDGFDVRTCDEIRIEDCVFRTGDDCIAGFDNNDVVVRGCVLDSACSMFRFGGNNVLVEDCLGEAPATYGHRYGLTDEEKKNRADALHCRRNCLNVFLYYCDNRAEVRRTPGNIVIRNSTFRNADALLGLPFGHIWCCNRSLKDIAFENCRIEGLCAPCELKCPEEEPLSLTLRDCVVTARKGCETMPFAVGENVKEIHLHNVVLENIEHPGRVGIAKAD